jgi:ketosteroid isomerase-like protein
MRKMLVLLSILAIVCTFCPAQKGSASSKDSVPKDARKGIDDFNRRFIESCRSMDHKAAADLWDEDGVDLLPGMEPMLGKAAIAKWLMGLDEQFKGTKVTQCDVDWQLTNVSGGLAYEWGINTQTVSIPDKPEPFKNKGKITLVLRRQPEGDWKLALESWNSSPQ